MQKTKDTDNIGHNFCCCGNFLYSINDRRIKIAKGNYVTYFQKSVELEIRCCKCNSIIKLKVQECMV